jgi:acyl carrier protein
MGNEARLRGAFSQALAIPEDQVQDTLAYNTLPAWDSVAHMALIGALEAEFGIMLETDDIIALSSYAKAREILSRYGVTFP